VAVVTGYCSVCSGSIGLHDRTLRIGQCAADLYYHPEGSRVWISGHGTLTVADKGGKIKGPHRFDIYQGKRDRCTCGHDVGRKTRHWEAR
jgi:3D (Asp-Asp-Asp) domain-containing protein